MSDEHVPADAQDLSAEEAHLLRSPANAARLRIALDSALRSAGEATSVDDLRRELGVPDEH